MLSAMIKIGATTLFCLFTLASFTVAKGDTPLEGSMKKISKAYKQLALDLKQPLDANKGDYLALANTIKTESQTARALVPKKAAALPPDQQATMVTAYQKSMDDFSASVDVLIQEITDSKWDDANKQIAALKMEEDDGHKAFRVEEKHGWFSPPPAPAASTNSVTPTPPAPPAAPPPPSN
jgi:hypothetical protein